MKKFLAVLAVAGVMISCNNKKDDKPKDGEKTDTAAQNTTPPATDPAPTTSTDVPKFSDAEVQKYVDDYTAFVTSYVEAYKTKDASKIQEYGTKAAEWAQRSTSVSQKLAANPDDARKFADYMTKLSKDIQDAMMPK